MSRFHEMLAKGMALQEAAKPAATAKAAPKILTQNPGNGYHGIAHSMSGGDTNKAHAEYKKMHAKVKDLAGEAGHLTNSKKPNIMVRDYLDSPRGRHLEGLQADDKYIKKDFGHFSKSYDPKLFESVELMEGDVTFHEKPDDHYNDGRTMIHIHHKGKHVATLEKLDTWEAGGEKEKHIIVAPNRKDLHSDDRFNSPLPDRYKKKTFLGKVKPGQEHEKQSITFDSRRSALRHAKNVYSGKLNESSDDITGTYSHQTRTGEYKNMRIAKHFSGTYHIHHYDGSKTTTDEAGARDYVKRKNAMWLKEGFDTGPDKTAAGILKVILEAKRNAKPHPDSLIDNEIDDKSFATRPALKEGILDRFKKKEKDYPWNKPGYDFDDKLFPNATEKAPAKK